MKYQRKNEVEAFYWDGSRLQGKELIKWVERRSSVGFNYWRAFFAPATVDPRCLEPSYIIYSDPPIRYSVKLVNSSDENSQDLLVTGDRWVVLEPGLGFVVMDARAFEGQYTKAPVDFSV